MNHMTCRMHGYLVAVASVVIAAHLCSSISRAEEPQEKPNFVIVFIDDMGWADWELRSDFFKTPNLMKFSEESVRFTRGYVNAANCMPSRACLLSGQYGPRHGLYNVWSIKRGKGRFSLDDVPWRDFLPTEHITFAEVLKENGYRTAVYGKWHVSNKKEPGTTAVSQGFEVDETENPKKGGPGDPKKMFSYTRSAMRFAENCVKENKPFLIYLSQHAVHSPLFSRPETMKEVETWELGERHKNTKYAAFLKDTDSTLGLVMEKIKSLGVDEETFVVFLSDNGGTPRSTQAPLRGFKGMLYEGGIRVPFMVRWPGRYQPAVCDTPVMAVDLYPTMLELAGIPAPDEYALDGDSLVPLLEGNPESLNDRAMFWHFPAYLDKRGRPSSVIMKGDWKLFLWLEPWVLDGGMDTVDTSGAIELYNLKDDIGETNNLALENKAVRDALLAELLAWQERVNAPIPKELSTRTKKGKK